MTMSSSYNLLMHEEVASTSLTEQTYLRLKREVIEGVFAPNQKLKIEALREHAGVSAGIAREVLSRLASDGLVVATPQKGFRIAPLEVSELEHLTKARVDIERMCLRDAIEHGDIRWESGIVSALHALSRTEEERGEGVSEVSREWADAHAAFHYALVATCRNPWYLRMREMLYIQSERYRAVAIRMPTGRPDLSKEHKAIAKAAIARDADKACALMSTHLRRTMDILVAAAHKEAPASS
jgi:DNA-binding GntR family transcriptional regulator